MKFLLRTFYFLLICNLCRGRTSENLKVSIDDGDIVGRYMTSISGKTIRAFLSIPYAAPPVEDLRFKAPKKPTPWQKVLVAHNEPPMCTQTNTLIRSDNSVTGQEDCLYLNVYAPDINTTESNKRLPVLVWIHGGGWIFGYSGPSFYGPEYLLEHDVILVAGNYRLGPLGFLSTEDEHCSGNWGFKDQLMILEWVQMNIDRFGGDRNSVTIFGESAGGASVNYHMFSPESRQLFHRAISQSGTLMNIWADPLRKGLAKTRAMKLADLMDCPNTEGTKEIVECLRKVPATKITSAVYDFAEWDIDPAIPFGPVVEDSKIEKKPFISDINYKTFSSDIPWMLGVTSEEGIFKSTGIINSKPLMEDLKENWKTAFPLTFYYDHLPKQEIEEINSAIYDFYFKERHIEDNKENITKMWSDGWIVSGFIENLQQRLKGESRDNTYVYLFTHKGTLSASEWLGGDTERFYGTCHLDELLYLFPIRQTVPLFENSIPTNEDIELRKLMTKLWVNFATTGNPTPEWTKESSFPHWSLASKFPLDYMQIGNENGNSDKLLQMKKDLFSTSSEFWIKIKEKYGLKVWKTDIKNKDEL